MSGWVRRVLHHRLEAMRGVSWEPALSTLDPREVGGAEAGQGGEPAQVRPWLAYCAARQHRSPDGTMALARGG